MASLFLDHSRHHQSCCCCSESPPHRSFVNDPTPTASSQRTSPHCSLSTTAASANCHSCGPMFNGATTESRALNVGHNFSDNGFVTDERRLMRALVVLSITSALALGIYNNLLVFSRFFWGHWSYLIVSGSALVSALSVYYAKCLVLQWGSRRVILGSQFAILCLVLAHFSDSITLYTLTLLGVASMSGPFFLAQLDFVQSFTVRLVHLSNVLRRYQAEQHQKLLHLLLISPSHIVGHALFVCLARATASTRVSEHPTTINTLRHPAERVQHLQSGSLVLNNPLKIDRLENFTHLSHQLEDLSTETFNHLHHQCRRQVCGSLFYIFNSIPRSDTSWMQLRHHNPLLATCLVLTFTLVLGAVIGALIVVFRRDVRHHLREQDPLERSYLASSIRHVLLRTFSDSHLRLLLPLAFFIGLVQAFFIADFQKHFVSCSLGLESVGLIMLTRGIVGLASTWLVHEFVRHINRPLILAAGAFCQVGVVSILSLWRADADLPLFYVVAACWALAGAIWETLLLTNILRSFAPDEWSTSLLTVFSFTLLGQATTFGISEFVCLRFKLYTLLVVLGFSLIPMRLAEKRLERLDKLTGSGASSTV